MGVDRFLRESLGLYNWYNAAGDIVSNPRILNRTELNLAGFSLDTVDRTGRSMQFWKPDEVNDVLRDWHYLVGLDADLLVPFAGSAESF